MSETVATVIVDVPRGSFIKRKDDGSVDFVSPLPSPFNYGHVPGTLAEDGDALDAVVLGPRVPRGVERRVAVQGRVGFIDAGVTDSKWISNPLSSADAARLQELIGLFQKYGAMYGFDWAALAAVGYQESRLDQNKRSRAGAIGIMQIRPSTAADKNVAITGIDTVENNIHAGAKYLAFLRDRYFADPGIPEGARFDFTLAAYNAGPARIASLRREAGANGYNPNLWFSNVETLAAARVGAETVTYVANVNKYYLAYTRFISENLQRNLHLQSLESAPRK